MEFLFPSCGTLKNCFNHVTLHKDKHIVFESSRFFPFVCLFVCLFVYLFIFAGEAILDRELVYNLKNLPVSRYNKYPRLRRSLFAMHLVVYYYLLI